MATGDDAIAAGMAVMTGTELANTLDTEVNKTRDYIAQRTANVQPVAKGGTDATTAAAARTNLGITAPNIKSGVGLASNVQTDLDYLGGASGLGSKASNAALASLATTVAGKANDSAVVHKSGDTMSGQLYLPASSAATSSFVVCYINGDGRVSRGTSSRRWKKFISAVTPASLGNLFPALVRYQHRSGNGDWQYGHIAEDLAADADLRRFVVFETEDDGKTLALDEDGQPVPLSIDFIALLLSQTAALNERVRVLEEAAHGA